MLHKRNKTASNKKYREHRRWPKVMKYKTTNDPTIFNSVIFEQADKWQRINIEMVSRRSDIVKVDASQAFPSWMGKEMTPKLED